MTSSSSKRPAALWLLACLPFLPLLLVFWAYSLPKTADGAVITLVGPWQGHPVEPGFDPFAADASGWKPLRLPGSYTKQGLPFQQLWLERTFDAPPAVVGEDSVFIVGSVRGATLRLFFNGEPIGRKGESNSRFIGLEAGAETFFVPGHLVKAQGNRLTIEANTVLQGRDGITDPRLLFGRHDVLGPWSFHEAQVRSLLEHGSLLLIAFLVVLLGVLWVLQGTQANVDMYRGTLGLLLAAAGYLLGKSGFVISAFFPGAAQMLFIVSSVHLIGLSIVEFVEAYYLQRTTWFRWVNRAVSGAAFVLAATGAIFTYRVYTSWLFAIMIYALVLAVRDLVKQQTLFGPLVAMATLLVTAAGMSDLLGDLEVIYAPRLFTFSVANLAAMCAAVVVAEFLELTRENERLLVKSEEGSRIKSEFLANTS
ncbi:MAG TPA: hypothetical protein VGD87_09790, partial [Archangium sp.]